MLSEEETWNSEAFRMRNGSRLVEKKGFDDRETPKNCASSLFSKHPSTSVKSRTLLIAELLASPQKLYQLLQLQPRLATR